MFLNETLEDIPFQKLTATCTRYRAFKSIKGIKSTEGVILNTLSNLLFLENQLD